MRWLVLRVGVGEGLYLRGLCVTSWVVNQSDLRPFPLIFRSRLRLGHEYCVWLAGRRAARRSRPKLLNEYPKLVVSPFGLTSFGGCGCSGDVGKRSGTTGCCRTQ